MHHSAKYWAQMALHVQDACNLSGIVFSFAKLMEDLCEASDFLNKGTDWKNKHPLCVLFLDKCAGLASNSIGDTESFHEAYDWCQEKVTDTFEDTPEQFKY